MFDHLLPNIEKVLTRYPDLFVKGLGYTLLLSLITVSFGALLGALTALMRRSRFKPDLLPRVRVCGDHQGHAAACCNCTFSRLCCPPCCPYRWTFRNSPASAWRWSLNSAGYVCEIFRAGIQAVDYGQAEAARSLGMTSRQTMLHIVFPQAIKNILPALCNEFVTVIKETSLASTFFIGDLMTSYNIVKGNMYLVLEPLIVVGVIYFVLTFVP